MFEDVFFYRLWVWNVIGESFSNMLYLNVIKSMYKFFKDILNIYCIISVIYMFIIKFVMK